MCLLSSKTCEIRIVSGIYKGNKGQRFAFIVSRRMRWAGLLARIGGEESCMQGFNGGKPEGKRPIGRPRRRWEDNIKMDLQEVVLGGHGLDRSGSG